MGCCGSDKTKKSPAPRRARGGASKVKRDRLRERRAKKFKFGGPTQSGKCFCIFDDGGCFRVENGKKWYIYNDTLGNEVHLTMRFDAANPVVKLGTTQLKKEGNKWVATIVVYPLETAPFVQFAKSGAQAVSVDARSRPLTQNYLQKVNAEATAKLQRETREASSAGGNRSTEEEQMYACRKKKVMYVDMSFRPQETALQRSSDKKKVQNLSSITWKRPTDYIPPERHKDISLFRDGIDPQDIDQGQLGDCWLMCSLSVLAGRPSFVRAMLKHPISRSKAKKEEKAGAYRVSVNKSGWWENVLVDSYLPTVNCQPIFGKCADDPCELWVALVEKAYAKIHGSYASIIGGDALYALQDFTGWPVHSFDDIWAKAVTDGESASKFFKDLRRYQDKGYFISISTPGHDTSAYTGNSAGSNPKGMSETYKQAGLAMGHAYSILDVRQFNFPNIKLLKIRNPWGSGAEWTGDWSDTSPVWKKHPFVRAACRPTKEDDGTFWMEWRDVVRFFDGGGVCMARRGWFDYRVRGTFHGLTPSVALEVAVRSKTKVVLELSQKDRRTMRADDPDILYKGLLISVAGYSKEKDAFTLVANSTSNPEEPSEDKFTFFIGRDVGLQLTLDPAMSPYYIIPRVMANREGTPKNFTLGFLAPKKVGSGGLQVHFRKIPSDHKALKNIPTYKMDEARPLQVEFQSKKPGKVASLRVGTSIQESKKVKK